MLISPQFVTPALALLKYTTIPIYIYWPICLLQRYFIYIYIYTYIYLYIYIYILYIDKYINEKYIFVLFIYWLI